MGTEVVELLNGLALAGLYEVVWNTIGSSSGVYFCALQTIDHRESRKLVVLR